MARVLRYSREEFLLHLHSRTSEQGRGRKSDERDGHEEEELGSHKEKLKEIREER